MQVAEARLVGEILKVLFYLEVFLSSFLCTDKLYFAVAYAVVAAEIVAPGIAVNLVLLSINDSSNLSLKTS